MSGQNKPSKRSGTKCEINALVCSYILDYLLDMFCWVSADISVSIYVCNL